MMHPHSRLRWISEEKGYGVFATEFIPKGTITYCQDPLDIVIPRDQIEDFPSPMHGDIRKYTFELRSGDAVLCWDNAKYVNHCCTANSLSTGYSFEVAVRDIQPGEEFTSDYRLFSNENHFDFTCENVDCPRSPMNELPLEAIDRRIQDALQKYRSVEQPLEYLVPDGVMRKLLRYLNNPLEYVSIAEELPLQRDLSL